MSPTTLEVFEALHKQVFQIHVRWAQFLALFTVSDDRMRFLSAVAPGFFRLLHDTLRDDAFISLGRLTDRSQTMGRDNLTLLTLVEAAEASGDASLSTPARSLLDQLLAAVPSIRTWRNQWLAHTDLQSALSPTPLPGVRVQRGDIDEALRFVREIMALFSRHFSREPYDYQTVVVIGDAEALVRVLQGH